ncbi:hypothetical protein Tco_0162179 [Tanacetum coccineum]
MITEYLERPGMQVEDPYAGEGDHSSGPHLSRLRALAPEREQAPPSPDYVPSPEHANDEIEDDDEDPEEYPVDYPADGGDDGDDEEGSSEEPFETDESAATPPPHSAYRVTARICIPAQVPTPVWSDAEIPSPSLPLSPPSHVLSPAPPPSPIRSLGYRAAMIKCTALGYTPPLPISVPTSLPPLLLPSASRREDRPEVTLPPRKRLGIALGLGYEVGESSSAAAARPAGGLRVDYGFVATMDREIRYDPERDVGYGITDSWDEIVETLQGAL